MPIEITLRRRVLITACLAAAGLFAVVSWSESQSTAVLAKASLDHARNLSESREAKVLQQFERQVVAIDASARRTSAFAAAALVLSFSSIVMLWLHARVQEPNKAPEPTPGSVTPRAND